MSRLMLSVAVSCLLAAPAMAQSSVLTGPAAFGGWQQDKPGVQRSFTAADIPAAKQGTDKESADVSNQASVVARPAKAMPVAPAGFSVALYAHDLNKPRNIRVAPNGDVFVAETGAGRILVFPADNRTGGAPKPVTFASGLTQPFGIAFFPTVNPQWIYVGEPGRIIRFPYASGDTVAKQQLEVIIPNLPSEHHSTRDVIVAPDGTHLLYSIGSGSNVAGEVSDLRAEDQQAFVSAHALGASWGAEAERAEVRIFDPEGKNVKSFATGLRNCTSMALEPNSANIWCVVNERDGLGDNTPPEYATIVHEGAFYGWPWFYIGANQDPRWPGARADLKTKVTVPDVLLQAHTAPLGITFYEGTQFPDEYRGDAFIAMHGSWNRSVRGGYKLVRMHMDGGKATGVVEDFLTGFVVDDKSVWGRPVGVAVTHDGSLLVSDDGSNSIWRISWKKK